MIYWRYCMTENRGDYWDWVSSQDLIDYTDKEDIRELLKQSFTYINPYLDKLFWVEANAIYLNQIYDVAQVEIAKYLGISQLGVSKRVRSGIRKLKLRLLLSNTDLRTLRADLSQIFTGELLEYATLLCKVQSVGVTNRILNKGRPTLNTITDTLSLAKTQPLKAYRESTKDYRKLTEEELESIQRVATKYYEFFNQSKTLSTVGDYLFKRDDLNRNISFDIFGMQ